MKAPQQQPALPLPGGVSIPVIGLGTWRMSGRTAYDAVRLALELGYRHFDTATMYGNEAEVGQAIRDSTVPREEIFVTTKLPPERAGAERETIEASLDALGTGDVDLWLVHWPPDGGARPDVWEGFLAARDDGLTRAVGVSNYSTAQVDELIAATGEAPAVNQIRWGPALHDPAVLGQHRERGVVVEGYSPLRTSDLQHPALTEVAEELGVTPAQVVLRWHLEHGVVAIPKAASPDHLSANLDVFGFVLTPEQVARVDAVSRAA